jgi:hypothetical protein
MHACVDPQSAELWQASWQAFVWHQLLRHSEPSTQVLPLVPGAVVAEQKAV